MAPNCAELITATLAAQLAGIAAPMGSGLSRQHLAELLRRSGARVLVTAGPDLAPDTWNTAQALARQGRLDAILVLRATGAAGPPEPLPAIDGVRIGYLADLAAAKDASAFVGVPPRSSDLAALFHTGGTTGAPKLAAHTHANEVADAWMLSAISLFDSGDRGPGRPAAVSRQRPRGHPARPAVQGAGCGVGRTARLPRPRAVRQLLEDRRALPDRRDERGAHGVRRARADPGRRRHQQPAVSLGGRLAAARRGPGRLPRATPE